MQTCIFPGRFQPFHEGHLMVVQGMHKACGNVTIVLCDRPGDGPFTVDERREMISAAMLAKDILDATIVTVRDNADDAQWVDHVLDAAGRPSEPYVWSGNAEVRAMFEAKGVATKKIVPVPGIASEDIRAQMRAGDGAWRKHVPSGAIDVAIAALQKKG